MRVHLTRQALWIALSLLAILTPSAADAEPVSDPVLDAVRTLVASLKPKQRGAMMLPFDDRSRRDWHFTPRRRKGLSLRDMNAVQRRRAHSLLQAALSERGYEKVRQVFRVERILRDNLPSVRRRVNPDWRDPLLYHVAVYGTPSSNGAWAWRIEGHHISIHLTYKNGRVVASTPLFIGTTIDRIENPPHKGRILWREQGSGRSLLMSLNKSQRKQATSPRGAFSFALRPQIAPSTLPRRGLALASMDQSQQAIVWRVVQTYFETLARTVATPLLEAAKKTPKQDIRFVWLGPQGPEGRFGFRVISPSFAIEFFNDNGHIHSVWRDTANDFGDQALSKK